MKDGVKTARRLEEENEGSQDWMKSEESSVTAVIAKIDVIGRNSQRLHVHSLLRHPFIPGIKHAIPPDMCWARIHRTEKFNPIILRQ